MSSEFMTVCLDIATYSPGKTVIQAILMNSSSANLDFMVETLYEFETTKRDFPLFLEDHFYDWQRMDNFIRAYLGKNFDITMGNPLLQGDLPEQKLSLDISRTEYVCYLYMLFLFAIYSENKPILKQFEAPQFKNVLDLFNINLNDGFGVLTLLDHADAGFLSYFKKFVRKPLISRVIGDDLLLKLLKRGYEYMDYADVAKRVKPQYWKYFFPLHNFPLYDDVQIDNIIKNGDKNQPEAIQDFKEAVEIQRAYYKDSKTRLTVLATKKKLDQALQELTYLKLVESQTTDTLTKSVMSIGINEIQKLYIELLNEYNTLLE